MPRNRSERKAYGVAALRYATELDRNIQKNWVPDSVWLRKLWFSIDPFEREFLTGIHNPLSSTDPVTCCDLIEHIFAHYSKATAPARPRRGDLYDYIIAAQRSISQGKSWPQDNERMDGVWCALDSEVKRQLLDLQPYVPFNGDIGVRMWRCEYIRERYAP